jgi:hypothetical protein
MITHLRGRPPEGWLASPETAPDGAARAEAQFQPARNPRVPCALPRKCLFIYLFISAGPKPSDALRPAQAAYPR